MQGVVEMVRKAQVKHVQGPQHAREGVAHSLAEGGLEGGAGEQTWRDTTFVVLFCRLS